MVFVQIWDSTFILQAGHHFTMSSILLKHSRATRHLFKQKPLAFLPKLGAWLPCSVSLPASYISHKRCLLSNIPAWDLLKSDFNRCIEVRMQGFQLVAQKGQHRLVAKCNRIESKLNVNLQVDLQIQAVPCYHSQRHNIRLILLCIYCISITELLTSLRQP